MNQAHAEKIANAVLYEGYILYPYRPSAVKNRQRWTFGGVYPRAYSEAQTGNDAWTMQTTCLVEGGAETRLDIIVRFLHIQERVVSEISDPAVEWPAGGDPPYRVVPLLRVGAAVYYSWQEAVEREVGLPDRSLAALLDHQE